MQHFMAFLTSNVQGSRKSRIWTMKTRLARSVSAGRSRSQAETVILQGTDRYEGLSAYLLVDIATDPETFDGAIVPGEFLTSSQHLDG